MTARSPSESGHATDFGGAECVEALVECDADLNFGGLAVRVSRGDAFAKGFEIEQVNATGSRDPARASLLLSGFGRGIRSSASRTPCHIAAHGKSDFIELGGPNVATSIVKSG